VLLAGLAAQVLWAWPWSRDLVLQIILHTQQQVFAPPEGSVASGREVRLSREVAARELRNPLPADAGSANPKIKSALKEERRKVAEKGKQLLKYIVKHLKIFLV